MGEGFPHGLLRASETAVDQEGWQSSASMKLGSHASHGGWRWRPPGKWGTGRVTAGCLQPRMEEEAQDNDRSRAQSPQ